METFRFNGCEIKYLEQGAGQPVVFVHGSVNDYRTWSKQMEAFSRHYHVIAYSRRYHFPYALKDDVSDYTVSLHADDLIAFLKYLKPGPVNLVGSSYGAYTALYVALKAPELVKTLVLGEPPVLPLLVDNPDNPMQVLRLLLKDFSAGKSLIYFGMKCINPAKRAFREGDLEEGVRLFGNGVLGKGGFDRLPAAQRAVVMANAPALKAEILGPGFPPFPKAQARKLTIPSLLVYGQNSPYFFHAIADKLYEILQGSERVLVPRASHRIHGDNPEVYNEKVLKFLAKHN